MNKSDLITALVKKENMSEKMAADIVNLIFDNFTHELKRGGRIEIRGLGAFSVREYGTHKGRNPKTGEAIAVKPKRLPHFKVGKELKNKVDGK